MAVELLKSASNSKGLYIFTHKEKHLFTSNDPRIRFCLESLAKKYVIGMHWGWFSRLDEDVPIVDFHLASPGTLIASPKVSTPIIGFGSRNFIPRDFKHIELPYQWE